MSFFSCSIQLAAIWSIKLCSRLKSVLSSGYESLTELAEKRKGFVFTFRWCRRLDVIFFPLKSNDTKAQRSWPMILRRSRGGVAIKRCGWKHLRIFHHLHGNKCLSYQEHLSQKMIGRRRSRRGEEEEAVLTQTWWRFSITSCLQKDLISLQRNMTADLGVSIDRWPLTSVTNTILLAAKEKGLNLSRQVRWPALLTWARKANSRRHECGAKHVAEAVNSNAMWGSLTGGGGATSAADITAPIQC